MVGISVSHRLYDGDQCIRILFWILLSRICYADYRTNAHTNKNQCCCVGHSPLFYGPDFLLFIWTRWKRQKNFGRGKLLLKWMNIDSELKGVGSFYCFCILFYRYDTTCCKPAHVSFIIGWTSTTCTSRAKPVFAIANSLWLRNLCDCEIFLFDCEFFLFDCEIFMIVQILDWQQFRRKCSSPPRLLCAL